MTKYIGRQENRRFPLFIIIYEIILFVLFFFIIICYFFSNE